MGNETSSKKEKKEDTGETKVDQLESVEKQNMSNARKDKQDSERMPAADPMKDLTGIIQDVQSTSKLMLQRLNDAVSGQQCTCECHSEEKQQELTQLKGRIEHLEKDGRKKDETLRMLNEELKALYVCLKDLQSRNKSVADGRTDGTVAVVKPDSKNCDTAAVTSKSRSSVQREAKKKETVDEPVAVEPVAVVKPDSKNCDTAAVTSKSRSSVQREAKKKETVDEPVIELDESSEGSVLNESGDAGWETEEIVDEEEPRGSDYVNTVIAHTSHIAEHSGSRVDLSGDGHRVPSVIVKPNFTVSGASSPAPTTHRTAQVDVMHQTISKRFPEANAWLAMASAEMDKARETDLKDLGGIHSVICVDISASMAEGGGWQQTQTFCHDYLNGLAKVAEDHGIDQEHVALVTFGHNCSVVKRFTNKMMDLKQAFDSLKLGGPSPMYAGLYFAYAAAGSSMKTMATVKGVKMPTKVIVLTDGEPTDTTLYEGPDIVELSKKDTIMAHIVETVEKLCGSLDVFFVPVGKYNKQFFELIGSVGDCKMLTYEDGVKMARRLYLTGKMEPMDFLGSLLGHGNSSLGSLGSQLSESDKAILEEIKRDGRKRMFDSILSGGADGKDKYKESTNENFPPVGTRVRRGPDWSWNNQDSNGPGTIIGHEPQSGQLWVHWDADDHINVYSYEGHKYDVLPVDAPRIITAHDRLQVGCVVKPGRDWDVSDTSVRSFDRGVVIKLLSDGTKLEVRWNNKKRGEYIFDVHGKHEIEYSAPDEHMWPSHGGHVLGSEDTPTPRKTKNKNKNQ